MAWSTPLTAVSNATLTAAQWNASVRDNLLETAPAKATTAGRLFVATGANAVAERAVGSGSVVTSETTTSTTFADLATVGPSCTITTGSTVIVILSCYSHNSAATFDCQMSVQVSGASSIAADSAIALVNDNAINVDPMQMSFVFPLTVTPGSNTFTSKYKVSGNTGTFQRRHLVVLPFG